MKKRKRQGTRWWNDERKKRGFRTRESEQKGRDAEKKFFEAWSNKKDYPNWLVAVHKAEWSDDSQGIDAWLVDVRGGKTPVQIKSSQRGAREHEEKHFDIKGIVVVVKPGFDGGTIRIRTLYAAEQARLPAWRYQT